MADFGGTDLDAFRAEAKAWLAENFPAELGASPATHTEAFNGAGQLTEVQASWKRLMGEKGWGVPTWPKAYGGGGLSPQEARVLAQEMVKIGAMNPIMGMGISMFGPTLLEYGSEEQKLKYIPDIATGKVRWCQGFSEPGAGSDLASLQTKAEDKGDHWIVNGSKIWTSGAQYADMIFCLVRTDQAKKHEGISFVLFSMHQPGVEIRPIKLIAGNSPFCETFFTDVKVSKEDLVGPLNGGWSVAKRLLQHERSGMNSARGGSGEPLGVTAKRYIGADDAGRLSDSDLRTRIVMNEMEARTVQQTVQRAALESKANAGPSAATSIMKNAFMKVAQDRAELTLEFMGHQGLGWEGEAFSSEELSTVRSWLSGKAGSIYGGSNEVQNNIISKRILGLPEMGQGA
ncbi:acyl-CoA dehydrogenase family protein [Phenylobacterium sp. NIBR 498073]|jgi:alkylation response protein AidB-like acyl-CoA dehydrogenase|uniref:acyl-CoA dehydrogenase family protein n=1 Tax=Phenylobacterium sp. NIBR 498073 TaxID=3015177 RepID=UPI0011D4FF2F|nr:acyl-CoA dehydrogenase family protein [Phenylobacterium sp. NIBR 498073]TXH20611.1 MAG: acyl-CoA dehydrogenase [Gammaproteobacteria bacterium]WGU41845.1 acyl-CoA dehydrogenase family protein [Phenylobacterium sp. NIBR 498073]